jgi:flavorubredoxin
MLISDSIKYVGVNDRKIDMFEGQYKVPDGISYNSYAVIDEKIAIMDSVDANFTDEWLSNISEALGEREPDYLVVLHMEPDHSANIFNFANRYPNAKIVSSSKAFSMMNNFFGTDFSERRVVVGEGGTLPLGERTLTFLTAPMVHWPEVIVAYDDKDKILFSADGFGKFGISDSEDNWADEARRYYIGIVGKYGAQVQALLKKAAALDIRAICPLHGPVLKNNLGYYISLYDTWSSYKPEEDGTVIAYTSVYGNTKAAVNLLGDELSLRGEDKVYIYDLARCDMAEAVAAAFRYSKLVLATTTYNASVFPHMREFINHLTERGYQKRQLALIENGSWAPMAAKVMRTMLEGCKEISYFETAVKISSALNEDSRQQIKKLADEITNQ